MSEESTALKTGNKLLDDVLQRNAITLSQQSVSVLRDHFYMRQMQNVEEKGPARMVADVMVLNTIADILKTNLHPRLINNAKVNVIGWTQENQRKPELPALSEKSIAMLAAVTALHSSSEALHGVLNNRTIYPYTNRTPACAHEKINFYHAIRLLNTKQAPMLGVLAVAFGQLQQQWVDCSAQLSGDALPLAIDVSKIMGIAQGCVTQAQLELKALSRGSGRA